MNLRSIPSLAAVRPVPLALTSCVTNAPGPSAQHVKHIKGTPQPDRWKLFLQKAAKGEIEEVPDEPRNSQRSELMSVPRDRAATLAGARTQSEEFAGHFRAEAKTSYAQGWKRRATDVESLLNGLPSD